MKNLLRIILINIIIFSVLAFVVISITWDEQDCGLNLPPQPHIFEGYAKYSTTLLASKTVTVTLDGVDVSTTTDSNGFYTIGTTRCADSSATAITFKVCTISASETATFASGATNASANLTISSACPAAAAPPGGGGGGGAAGGGAGVAVSAKTDLDLKTDFATTAGVTLKQTQGDTATFTVGGVEYTVEVTKLTADSVTLTAGDQLETLNIGDTVYFDVNEDGVDDISVTLKGIDGGRAELVYKKLDSGMLALLDMIRDFYAGTSPYTMMEILDKIRAFYGG